MISERWRFILALAGMTLFVGGGLFLVTTSSSPQSSAPEKTTAGPTLPTETENEVQAPDSVPAEPKLADATARAGAAPLGAAEPGDPRTAKVKEALGNGSSAEQLKGYEELWVDPAPAEIRVAEQLLFRQLEALPPSQLVALLVQGINTRSANLVSITLENAMGGPRRSEYENALVMAMQAAAGQPDKLALLSEIARHFDVTRG